MFVGDGAVMRFSSRFVSIREWPSVEKFSVYCDTFPIFPYEICPNISVRKSKTKRIKHIFYFKYVCFNLIIILNNIQDFVNRKTKF